MDIRMKLRLLRVSAGYSQQYVADTISDDPEFKATLEKDGERNRGQKKNIEKGLAQKRVSHIENQRCHVREHVLRSWCKVLLITEAELYSESIGHLTDLMLERMAARRNGKG